MRIFDVIIQKQNKIRYKHIVEDQRLDNDSESEPTSHSINFFSIYHS